MCNLEEVKVLCKIVFNNSFSTLWKKVLIMETKRQLLQCLVLQSKEKWCRYHHHLQYNISWGGGDQSLTRYFAKTSPSFKKNIYIYLMYSATDCWPVQSASFILSYVTWESLQTLNSIPGGMSVFLNQLFQDLWSYSTATLQTCDSTDYKLLCVQINLQYLKYPYNTHGELFLQNNFFFNF